MRGTKIDRDTTKIIVRVFSEDIDLAKQVYSKSGYNNLIRNLLSRHMAYVRQLLAERETIKEIDLD